MFDGIQCSLYLQSFNQHRSCKSPLGGPDPAVPKPFYKNPALNVRPVPFARPLILCIEDDPIYLDLRKKVLQNEGYDVLGVSTAGEALKVLREAPVCATIADHMLQGTSGTDLAKEMKSIRPDVPIVIFSGTIPGHLQNIDVYVNKGEPTAEFLKIVRNVIERYCS